MEENGHQESFTCDSEGDIDRDGNGMKSGDCEWAPSDKEFLTPCLELAKVKTQFILLLLFPAHIIYVHTPIHSILYQQSD